MYIFELISTIINKIKNPEKKIEKDFSDEYQNCEHTFVPVDSTKKVENFLHAQPALWHRPLRTGSQRAPQLMELF